MTHNPEDLDAYFGRALPELRALQCQVTLNPLDRDLTTEELLHHSADHHVIIAHRATPGEAELFENSPALLAFLRTAVDISTVNVAAANESGVVVAHADKSFVASTAELALGLLIDSMRSIAESTHDYRGGLIPPQRPGRQLRGQTAGIIGFGAIGSYLADVLDGIGMTVLVHDPFVEVGTFDQISDFDDFLGRCDVVFPLAPATAETMHLIDRTALAAMKRGATLINVSRGELLDEDAVAEALQSGQLRAVGLDVGSAPDQRPATSLAQLHSVVATPHLGGLTPENADAQALSAVEQVAAMLNHELPPRIADAGSVSRLHNYWAGAS